MLSKQSRENQRAAQQVIGREGETATFSSRCVVSFGLRVGGFAPRQLRLLSEAEAITPQFLTLTRQTLSIYSFDYCGRIVFICLNRYPINLRKR